MLQEEMMAMELAETAQRFEYCHNVPRVDSSYCADLWQNGRAMSVWAKAHPALQVTLMNRLVGNVALC